MTRIRIDDKPAKPAVRTSKSSDPQSVTFLPSGCTLLDKALGGGWAERRIANIVGDSSVGKTLLVMEGAANFTTKHKHGRVRYKETESAFDPRYAGTLGMPLDRIDFGDRIHTIEDLFDDLNDAIKSCKGDRAPVLEIVDSLDALTDNSELERGFSEASYGTGKARDLSKLFRMLTAEMERSSLTLMIVSQVRSNIGVSFGRQTTRAGGKALKFYCSQIVYLTHVCTLTRTIKNVKRPHAIEVVAKVDKNKVGPPLREIKFKLDFGYGIDDLITSLAWLKEVGYLSDVGCPENGYNAFIKRINEAETEAEFRRRLAPIQEAAAKRWDEVERGFLPKRRKYNGLDAVDR